MYGYIGDWEEINDIDFINDLRILEGIYQNINLRINCGGGDVHKGITIFNAIKNSKVNIEGYIDGIAASMGAVIAAGCKKLYMSKFARYMTHRVKGSIFGDSDKLKSFATELEALEDVIAKVLGERTGLTQEEAKAKYITTQDRWIGADQALQEKLIDEVYDADPVDVPENSTEEQLVNVYAENFTNKYLKPVYNMKEIALALGLAEDATEAEIKAAIEKQKADKKTAEDALKVSNTAKAKALVATALNAGKITQTEVEGYEAQAENNYDFVASVLNKLPVIKKPSEIINQGKLNAEGKEDTKEASGWEALVAMGSTAVNDMKQNDFAGYKKLWEAHYGQSYPVSE